MSYICYQATEAQCVCCRVLVSQYVCCHVTVAHCLCCDIHWRNIFVAMLQWRDIFVARLQWRNIFVTMLQWRDIFARLQWRNIFVARLQWRSIFVARFTCSFAFLALYMMSTSLHGHQLLPHGFDGTASRNSPVSFGGQVSEPGNCWQPTAGKRWSCWQRTGWWVSSGRVQPDGDNNNGYLDHCRLTVQLLARELELENFIFQGLYFSITQDLSNSVVLAKLIMIICLQGIIYIRIWSVDEWVKIYTRGKTTSTQTLACSLRQMHTEYTCIQCIHHSVIHVYKHSASRSTDRTSKTFI